MENCKIFYLGRSDGVETNNRPTANEIGTADSHAGREHYIPLRRDDEAYQAALKGIGMGIATRFGELGKLGKHAICLFHPTGTCFSDRPFQTMTKLFPTG